MIEDINMTLEELYHHLDIILNREASDDKETLKIIQKITKDINIIDT